MEWTKTAQLTSAARHQSNQTFFSACSSEWASWRKLVDCGVGLPQAAYEEWVLIGLFFSLWVKGGSCRTAPQRKREQQHQSTWNSSIKRGEKTAATKPPNSISLIIKEMRVGVELVCWMGRSEQIHQFFSQFPSQISWRKWKRMIDLWVEQQRYLLIAWALGSSLGGYRRRKPQATSQRKRQAPKEINQWSWRMNGNGNEINQMSLIGWIGMSLGPLQVKWINSIHSTPLLLRCEQSEAPQQQKRESWWNWAAGSGIVFSLL